ncbi:streptococcal histidine triad protein PhpA [Streptococcus pneumoniae]|nr:streptococcal histidine triad protein PhpA [Streptococcus pneumoniae]VKR25888.1 streptococcal histidine triad protein PhpA [Streptococcus pneumoniae]VOB81164.1 streptococcal histidine triad protein PhpA [Streptococcus pneumoniae]VRU86287.1 streptococcal histidine triad protein PhpA [Streptococcus pneumoniae]VRZ61921.1 streptococcal histidine triad protein PhpA [Streptococcus pneumoniae]
MATVKYYVEHPNERPHSDNGFGNASDHVQRNKNGQADTNQTEKPNEEKPQTEKSEEETPREEKPQSEKPESPKPTEESEEESPEESEEPQVETEKVKEKLREAEDLLGKIQDPIIKSNAKETLTGLKNNLLFGTQDNNTIEESPEESEEPQVETEKVKEKLREAEDLLGKIQDPIIKSNAKETLTGLKNNLLFGTQDNNTIMAEAEKLLALLKESK